MSVILLPLRFRQQPQYPARLDPSHPLFKDLVLAYSAGRGLHDAKHGFGSTVGTMLQGAGQKGRYIQPSDGSSYAQFASIDDYNILGEITIFARIRTSSLGSQQAIVIKSESGGGTNTPFGLLIESDGSVSLNRATSTGGASFRVWASAAKLSANTDYVIVVSQGGDISVGPAFYINGIPDSGAPSSLYSGNGSGPPAATAQSVKLGNRTDLASRFLGGIYDVLVFRRMLAAPEIAALSSNVWSVWKAPERRIFISSGATNYTLTADPFLLELTALDASLEYNHALSADPVSLSFNVSDATLKRGHTLTADPASIDFSGADAALKYNRALQAESASLSVTGADASLEYNRVLQADATTLSFDVADATLTHTQPGNYVLAAASATLGIAVADASLRYNRKLTADPVEMAFNGADASCRYARAVIAESVQIAFNVSGATLTRTGGPEPITSLVERTAVFQRSKSVTVRFN